MDKLMKPFRLDLGPSTAPKQWNVRKLR